MENLTKSQLQSYLERELDTHKGISINLSLPHQTRKGTFYFKVRGHLTELEVFLDYLFYFRIPQTEPLYVKHGGDLKPLTIFNIGDYLTSYANYENPYS